MDERELSCDEVMRLEGELEDVYWARGPSEMVEGPRQEESWIRLIPDRGQYSAP